MHEAEIDVTESGSEAAAATAVVIGTRTVGGDKNRLFKVDRPFIFIIQDKKFGIPLFVGRIVDPTGQRTLNASQ